MGLEKRTNQRARARLIIILSIILATLCVVELSIGAAPLSAQEGLVGLFDHDSQSALIVRDLRLPRLILAMTCGAGLGLCGAASQSLTRNPLADPGLFGAPQTAAFGAVLMLSGSVPDVLSFSCLLR